MGLLSVIAVIISGAAGDCESAVAQKAPLALRAVAANASIVPRYGLFELSLDLSATYDNPFNPADIDVWAVFDQNRGASIRVNGFLNQEFSNRLKDDNEIVEAQGDPGWRIRFSPPTDGEWNYVVHVKDRTGETQSKPASFSAKKSDNPGPAVISGADARYFSKADGSPFFAVGENICWPAKRGLFDYAEWFRSMGLAGGNWARVWMWSHSFALEWTGESKPGSKTDAYTGVGFYNLQSAWRLDKLLDMAEQNGVSVMLCFGTYGEFNTGGYFNEGQWNINPYNAANGGPCAKPEDFWTDARARELYRQRLRYIAARYGWRTNLFAWEFWNEANAPAQWIGEMARFMKGVGEFAGAPADAFGHLVSTTYGTPDIWKTPEIDFTMTHHYGQGDVPDSAPVIHSDARGADAFKKPHLMAEFGIDWRKDDRQYDPNFNGVNLRNGLWASACSGNAGGAMLWYWDSYIHPGNLYGAFGALRRFSDGVPWTTGRWKQAKFDAPIVAGTNEERRDLILNPTLGWGLCKQTDFTITQDSASEPMALPNFFYAPSKPDLRSLPVFHVKYEKPGRFIAHVNSVSYGARFQIKVDGNTALDVFLSANPPSDPNEKPAYESTRLRPEYNSYEAFYNRDYSVDVPAGSHDIALDVSEGDWLSVGKYVLTDFTNGRFANLTCYGMTNGDNAVAWFHNADSNWKNAFESKTIEAVAESQTKLKGLKPGRYVVEWWDTIKGEAVRHESISASDDGLDLRVPEIYSDIAARIKPNGL